MRQVVVNEEEFSHKSYFVSKSACVSRNIPIYYTIVLFGFYLETVPSSRAMLGIT